MGVNYISKILEGKKKLKSGHACMISPLVVFNSAPPWTVAPHAPLSMGFSRQEYWSWMPCPPSGDPPDPEIELVFLVSPALAGSLPVVPPGKPNTSCSLISITKMRTITSTHISYLAVHVCTQACVCAHRRVCILHYLLSLSHFHMCVHIIYCQVMTFIYLAVLTLSCSMWDLVP